MVQETDPEKHYRELVMLFTAYGEMKKWTYLVHILYNALSKAINEQMKQYTVCNEDFNEIQQQMNTLEESYDTI